MPKYEDENLNKFRKQGYMDFWNYDKFSKYFCGLKSEEAKLLAIFLFFTGSRPSEVVLMLREYFSVDGKDLIVKIPTTKRREDVRFRFIRLGLDIKEVNWFWERIKDLPNGFYIFPKLRKVKNPRQVIKKLLGISAMFFRHNLFSRIAQVSSNPLLDIKELKGAKSELSVLPYLHLSFKQQKKLGGLIKKAIL
ncbi:MAG: hypothetical protein QW156_04450 [Candidatus Aenigmatarchaeota archaeon]